MFKNKRLIILFDMFLNLDDLKSFLVYKFTCASCSSGYTGETCRYFKATIEEHIKDNKSHVYKHWHSTATCFDSYKSLCFGINYKANSNFSLKIKKGVHINWRKTNLNAQQNHFALILPLKLLSPLVLFCHCFLFLFLLLFFAFFFHLLFSLSLTLIIDIF